MWKCDKCGSEEVQQEYSVMVSMNSEDGWGDAIENCNSTDFCWCPECDDECFPIREKE